MIELIDDIQMAFAVECDVLGGMELGLDAWAIFVSHFACACDCRDIPDCIDFANRVAARTTKKERPLSVRNDPIGLS